MDLQNHLQDLRDKPKRAPPGRPGAFPGVQTTPLVKTDGKRKTANHIIRPVHVPWACRPCITPHCKIMYLGTGPGGEHSPKYVQCVCPQHCTFQGGNLGPSRDQVNHVQIGSAVNRSMLRSFKRSSTPQVTTWPSHLTAAKA